MREQGRVSVGWIMGGVKVMALRRIYLVIVSSDLQVEEEEDSGRIRRWEREREGEKKGAG